MYPPGGPGTDDEALLLLYAAPPLGDEFLGAAKIAFGSRSIEIAQQKKDACPTASRRIDSRRGIVSRSRRY